MAITDWPADERPREKLLARGAAALSDAELLAIFLRTGVRGKSAVDLARDLLNHFGDLNAILSAPRKEFTQANGLGDAKYTQLQAVMEMARRHLRGTLKKRTFLNDPDATRDYLLAALGDAPRELFGCLLLDTRHCVLHFEILFQGTIDGAAVYPREVVKLALEHNAAAVILTHNHPSGVAEPSQADQAITRRIDNALKTVDIRLLDHCIVGNGTVVSMAELGLL